MKATKPEYVQEMYEMLGNTWKGVILSAGMIAGIFPLLHEENATTIQEIADASDYDPVKLNMLLYYLVSYGFVSEKNGGYVLSEKGGFLSPDSQDQGLTGLLMLTEYFMLAAVDAKQTFKKNKSLDKLSVGKISRDYQPKVTDNFSVALKDIFLKYLDQKDSLLDIGCGNGSLFRALYPALPEINFIGLDKNLFAIEKGKKETHKAKMDDRINFLVGDMAEDMTNFEDNSYDWVSAINVFHFVPVEKRFTLIEHMIRMARKGLFITQVVVESNPLAAVGNPLTAMLWNDFTGYFTKSEIAELDELLEKKYHDYTFERKPIMSGHSTLLIMYKKQ